jgi:M6 family metalloprotease-like protein
MGMKKMFKSLFNGSDLKYRKLILFVSVIVITCFILAQGTFAAEQTSKQGLNKTKNVISYQKYPITNDNQNKVDPWLLNKFKNRLKISTNNTNFRTRELGLKSLPTVWQGGLPSTGNVKVLVLLVDFPDYPHSSSETVELAQSKFFGDGNPNNYPYESLKNYYLRSSYGKLNINGTVLGWYTAQHNRDYYKDKGSSGREDVLMEVLSYYNTLGHDFSQYDNDNNGKLDAIYVKWTGPDTGWSTFFWACQSNFRYNPTFSVDGKKLNKYIWSWFTNEKYGDKSDSIRTDIHETGHILGLPDYYDYKAGVGPDGGVGKLDMMDGNWGDHNCFSKFLLGWIDPTVISSGQQLINLHPTGSWPEAVIIMTNATLNPFQEFFMVQYRKKVLNDTTYPTNGLLIWHIDGRLKADGSNFLYDNSYTDHKLLRLMEADGLEEIEKNVKANVGDFYVSPNTFSKFTNPNSDNYNSQTTGVRVDNISTSGNTISARFGFYYDLYGLSNPLNNQELEWNSTGTTNPYTGSPSVWQKYILNDEYVQSGPIYYNGKSELSTVVNQPGTLKFWWAVSSQDNYDTLTFYDNEDPIYTISGEHWYLDQITYNISTPGQHILSWRYAKNDDFIVGFYDCGLLDKVEWTPDENTPPLVSIDPITGFYNSDQTITLTMNEPGNIYYTLNGSTPTLDSNLYTGPFNITSNTNLMILAQDLAGNLSYYTEHYLFDKKSPTASSTPQSGTYFTDQLVRLTMDEEGSIYYTTNGLNPNTNSNLYTGPISITSTTTLKYIALDLARN